MIKSRCYQLSEAGHQIFQFKKQVERLRNQLEQAGLVKNKARLLAEFSQSQAEAEKLTNQTSFWTLLEESERFYSWLDAGKKESYLQVAKLASLADDKEKQDQVFRILEVLAGQEIQKNVARTNIAKPSRSQKNVESKCVFPEFFGIPSFTIK